MTHPVLPPPVRAFFAALDADDADAAAALIAPDGVVHDEGESLDLTGPAAAAEWVRAHLIAARVRLEPVGAVDAGETVAVDVAMRVGDDAQPLTSAFRFAVAGDRLADVRIAPPR